MTNPLIRIKTEEFRAIGKADIIINGITVVAGENGCGKSTLSKLLYYLYKTASNYELLVSQELRYKLKNVERFLDISQHDLISYSKTKDRSALDKLRKELFSLRNNVDSPIIVQLNTWLSLINNTASLFSEQPDLFSQEINDKKRISTSNNRLRYIIKDILKTEEIELGDKTEIPFEKISEFVEVIFKDAAEKIKLRPSSLFKEALMEVFSDERLPYVFDVVEFEEEIISLRKEYLSIPYLIQNVIYIDTPMIIGIDSSNNDYWNDLNLLLSKKGTTSFSEVSKAISKEIIHGDVSIDDNSDFSNDFTYKRDDGSMFNLLDCATGIKSFAIIQLLIKNGSINDKTLLIIDEPESNLHPQWIIEYARLIVLINKKIGAKFFIASHNPDMVSAIRYISEKEAMSENLNFYLAEISENYLYNYRTLGTDIDPIFASFNIAIDRINQYGS